VDHVPTISTPIGLFGDDEDIICTKKNETHSSRPAGGPWYTSTPVCGVGDDDDEDISALFAAKPPAVDCASKKGLCHCVFCPVFVVCENTQVKSMFAHVWNAVM